MICFGYSVFYKIQFLGIQKGKKSAFFIFLPDYELFLYWEWMGRQQCWGISTCPAWRRPWLCPKQLGGGGEVEVGFLFGVLVVFHWRLLICSSAKKSESYFYRHCVKNWTCARKFQNWSCAWDPSREVRFFFFLVWKLFLTLHFGTLRETRGNNKLIYCTISE